MDEELEFGQVIDKLKSEGSTSEIRSCIEALIKIFRNVVANPEDEKFRKIRCQNAAFQNKIGSYYWALRFLQESGWIKVEDSEEEYLYFPSQADASIPLNALIEHRILAPCASEGDRCTGFVNLARDSEREKELRRKAAEVREKELAECLKDKKERQELAERIKAEHKADRAKVEERVKNLVAKKL